MRQRLLLSLILSFSLSRDGLFVQERRIAKCCREPPFAAAAAAAAAAMAIGEMTGLDD